MEIETTFHVLVGIIIVAVVIIAVIAIALSLARGSRVLSVKECIPVDYTANNIIANSVRCGIIGVQSVFCNNNLDTCMDQSTNKCCNTSDSDVVFYSKYRCCKTTCSTHTDEKNCTDASCSWCSRCENGIEQRAVNQWNADKCVAPGINCGYHCVKNECSASCDATDSSACISSVQHCSITTDRCDCELGT